MPIERSYGMNKDDFINEIANGLSEISVLREKLENTILLKGENVLISYLNECKISTPSALASVLDVTPARIAAILRSLEKKDFILRGIDIHDKRRVIVKLTEKGTEFAEKLKRDIEKHSLSLFESLGENDATEFLRLIKKISEC